MGDKGALAAHWLFRALLISLIRITGKKVLQSALLASIDLVYLKTHRKIGHGATPEITSCAAHLYPTTCGCRLWPDETKRVHKKSMNKRS